MSRLHWNAPRSMIPVTGSGRILRKQRFLAGSRVLPVASGRKKHRKMEAVFPPELHRTRKRENLASSLSRILSVSKRVPSGKPAGNQCFPSEPVRKSSYRSRISPKKYRFSRHADKVMQYFLGNGKINKKTRSKISVRLSLF